MRPALRCSPRAGARGLVAFGAVLAFGTAAIAAVPWPGVHLEDMTSHELQARIDAGVRTALIPIGGTEQNGAHMVLGKHNVRVMRLAENIAEALGDAIVAPVLPYVPEGRIEPPTEHMRWAGTLSIPESAFEAVVEGAAASLCRHGFREVVLLGDHGGYQAALRRVAEHMTRSSRRTCRVLALPEYYQAAQGGFAGWLTRQGYPPAEVGTHAGLADTALALAVAPGLVRSDAQARGTSAGVTGDPRRATVALGRVGVAQIVDRSVAAIRQHRLRP